jgi:hypothetical protein
MSDELNESVAGMPGSEDHGPDALNVDALVGAWLTNDEQGCAYLLQQMNEAEVRRALLTAVGTIAVLRRVMGAY